MSTATQPEPTLTAHELSLTDAYWRAANYMSVGQLYLLDNPLLKRPLEMSDIKHMLLGHWGTGALGHWGTGARRRGRISSTRT